MATKSTRARLAEIAEDQWGLVTRRQAEHAGVSSATMGRLAADGDVLERVAHSVYRLAGSPIPDHLDLRAAWLQLAPATFAWERTVDQGVVSHRSAAALYALGHLPADHHDFTVTTRRQTRRSDVRLHKRPLENGEWITLRGLPVTRPSRIASDLLQDQEDPESVAQIIADAIRGAFDDPGTFADALAPHAARFGLRKGDGVALLRWLLGLLNDPETPKWIDEAHSHVERAIERDATANDEPPVAPGATP